MTGRSCAGGVDDRETILMLCVGWLEKRKAGIGCIVLINLHRWRFSKLLGWILRGFRANCTVVIEWYRFGYYTLFCLSLMVGFRFYASGRGLFKCHCIRDSERSALNLSHQHEASAFVFLNHSEISLLCC